MSIPKDFLLDRRIIDRNIDKGLVTKEAVEDHLASLPDKTSDLDMIEIESPDIFQTKD